MIQRIQSIYLLVSILVIGGLIFLANTIQVAPEWFPLTVQAIAGLQICLALWALFSYADRKKQVQLVTWNMWFVLLLEVVLAGGLYAFGQVSALISGEVATAGWSIFCMPLVAFLFYLLARSKVKADIKLVKSMDRLR